MSNAARIRSIVASARKYGRTLRKLSCHYNEETGQFHYGIAVAKRGSGAHGGRLQGYHEYELLNLTPEERAGIRKIRHEPGHKLKISQN